MYQEKQIEKMAKIIRESDVEYAKSRVKYALEIENDLLEPPPPRSTYIATELYTAGFRERGEWISVDERLPEEGVPVLVYKNKNSDAYGNMETAYFDNGRWRGSCGAFITHWRPLLEPPQM